MAYRTRARRGKKTSSSRYSRRPAARTSKRRNYRTTNSSRPRRAARSAAQTIRIVVEQPNVSSAGRPISLSSKVVPNPAPRNSRL